VTTRIAAAALGLALAACGRTIVVPTESAGGLTTARGATSNAGNSKGKIRHVIFVIQENRSFNNLFLGYPGATTQSYGYDTNGNKIALVPIGLATQWDIDHSSTAFFNACDGRGKLPGTKCKMDGWNNESATLHHPPNPAYAYVPRDEIKPYWTLARRYALSDRTFASNLDGSFVSHQYAVAAYASRSVDGPDGPWGCEGGKNTQIATLTSRRTIGKWIRACFDFETLGGEADAAGVTWRFYTGGIHDDGGIWSSYQADRRVFQRPDWKHDVVNPPSRFLSDVRAGTLADITWITPVFAASDHAGVDSADGPAWVASLVNAVGRSPFWKSTAIFVMWDDWGGWFDPVKPVYEDYDGLGFRVPLLIVSPYAKRGSVTHEQYETASVLRFIEDTFGLSQLAAADARANDPAADPQAFDFSQPPRAFQEIPDAKPVGYWQVRNRAHVRGTILGDD